MKRGHSDHGDEQLPKRRVHVVAAAIYNGDERVFLSRRPSYVDQGGLWEFPGGKLHPHETGLEALKRELNEELGIHVKRAQPLIRVHHEYTDKHILLDVWGVRDFEGEPYGREGQVVRWVPVAELGRYNFPAANLPIIKAVALPHAYMITADQADETRFETDLAAALERHRPKLVRLRDTALDAEAYAARAERAVDICRRAGAQLMLGHRGSDVEAMVALVERLDAGGLHLGSDQLGVLERRPLEGSRWLGASVHDAAGLAQAERLDCDFAVLSPVRATGSHPDAQPLGWHGLQQMIEHVRLPVFALGGLGLEDIDHARGVGAQGVAAISAFER
ncbi:Nudix family hydrolase [Halotalea alkalilenta]|uniref:Nudix family hydrolase n=1 Tax=Halotalea alkalilenta TaxID=376489 RepID=UPI000A4421CA|nr:Nudix family hydrolase [Halotalea alkalilenta]